MVPAIEDTREKRGIERLHALRMKLMTSVTDMELAVHNARKKLEACDFHIEHGGNGYDVEELKKEHVQIAVVLETLVAAADTERKRLEECESQVVGEEKILLLHHPQHVCNVRGFHTWTIDKVFEVGPHRGEWRKRHCAICATAESLGKE